VYKITGVAKWAYAQQSAICAQPLKNTIVNRRVINEKPIQYDETRPKTLVNVSVTIDCVMWLNLLES